MWRFERLLGAHCQRDAVVQYILEGTREYSVAENMEYVVEHAFTVTRASPSGYRYIIIIMYYLRDVGVRPYN